MGCNSAMKLQKVPWDQVIFQRNTTDHIIVSSVVDNAREKTPSHEVYTIANNSCIACTLLISLSQEDTGTMP